MKTRLLKTERLDDLSMNGTMLQEALTSLAWINRRFGNHRSVLSIVNHICRNTNQTWHIVDLACGGGDLARALASSLNKQNIRFHITGIDGNNHTLAYAQKKSQGMSGISFIQADILHPAFRIPACDILLSSHFMYHFSDDALVNFLKNNMPAVSSTAVFSELKRSPAALFLFRYGSIFLPVSKLARQDGMLAIKRSLTKKEWIQILSKAGIDSFQIQNAFLFRLLLKAVPNKQNHS